MVRVFLLLGSNEGDRRLLLAQAVEQIELRAGNQLRISSLYETAAWGTEDQPPFLNRVLEIRTHLSPEVLLKTLQSIETSLGRVRHERWASRTMDIDILFYGNRMVNTPSLIIPHAAIAERRFTLVPLAEVAPDFVHPVLGKTVQQLLDECGDRLAVSKVK